MHGMDSLVGGRRTPRVMNVNISSPERMKKCTQQATSSRIMRPAFKRVQVVYYLTRNGQLEQPHFMEVTHLAAQPLRLKDVMDRLTVLRGKGMPSMYSWSCKRCYKSGYVWNDLSENDIIYPSEGAEYILKGSEVITDASTAPQVGSSQRFHENINFYARRKAPNHIYANEEEVFEDKIRYIYPAAASHHPRCSRGVSTGGLLNPRDPTTEINLENSSSPPPSTTSSSLSDKGMNETSKRFEDGDAVVNEPLLSRNSMLFQLIACGGALSFRGKSLAGKSQPPPSPPTLATGRRSSCSDIHREVLCKSVKNKKAVVEDEDVDEIKCMSENPRFGNLQSEEREYFSGSIVESMCTEEREPSTLKKSSSYNEERDIKEDWREYLKNAAHICAFIERGFKMQRIQINHGRKRYDGERGGGGGGRGKRLLFQEQMHPEDKVFFKTATQELTHLHLSSLNHQCSCGRNSINALLSASDKSG